MIYCKEVQEYLDLVRTGKVVVSEENHLLISNVVLPLLDRSDITFDSEIYYNFIAYAEKYYFPLFPYQKFLAFFHFLYYEDDSLVFNEYFYYMGRGNGKDGFIAPLINFFQTPYFGVKNYDIDIIANSESQAKLTFKVAYDCIKTGEHCKLLKQHFAVNAERIISKKTNSVLEYNTSNGKTKDGKRPGCVVFNELHAYENYDNIKVHTSGMGKVRWGRIINISTDGEVRGGPLDDMLALSRQKINGMHPTLRLFPFICKLDDEKEHKDFVAIEKANPSIHYLPTLKQTIETELSKIAVNESLYLEFITKRMNIPKIAPEKCVTEWENIVACNRDLPDLEGRVCICGIDYADIRDFVTVGLLFKVGEELVWIQHTFVCKNSPTLKLVKFDLDTAQLNGEVTMCDGPIIDEQLIGNWIYEQMPKYRIQSISMDTFRYNLLKPMFEGMGFTAKCKANPDGNIILVRTGPITHNLIAPTIEKYFSLQRIVWGNCRIMNWFTNNTKVTMDAKGNKTYGKISPVTRKNDGFMAFVHAMTQLDSLNEAVYELFDVIT